MTTLKMFLKYFAVVTAIGIPTVVLVYALAMRPSAKPEVKEVHVTVTFAK